jgi:hypothetical protein
MWSSGRPFPDQEDSFEGLRRRGYLSADAENYRTLSPLLAPSQVALDLDYEGSPEEYEGRW